MANYTTGICYHPSFSRRSYLTVGARLADFPAALVEILKSDNVLLCEPEPVPRQLLLKVHTPDLLERVEREPLCSTAWHSAGGVVSAGEKIASGEIANAFVFIGAGGHHARNQVNSRREETLGDFFSERESREGFEPGEPRSGGRFNCSHAA